MNIYEKLNELNITLRRTGTQTCPKCSHARKKSKDKCLGITFEGEIVKYHCFNDGCDFEGIISNDKYIKPIAIKKTYTLPKAPVVKTNKERVYEYFQKRGISKETVDAFKVELSDRQEIVFPFIRDDKVVNYKYRDSKKKFRQEKNTESIFFGMHLINPEIKELVICEGEIDAMSFYEAGIQAVSVPQGATEKKMEYIDNCFEWLDSFDSYVIAVDKDPAGEILKENLLNRLEKYKCKIVDWGVYSIDGKDANDFLKSKDGGVSVLKEAVEIAKITNIEGIETFGSAKSKIMDFYRNGYTSGVSTGFNNVDKIFKIKTGNLMIITGIPASGKSFFADNLIFNLTQSDGWKHLICTMENSIENHFSRFAEMYKKKSFDKKNHNSMTEKEVSESMDFLDMNFYRFTLDKRWKIEEIIKKAIYCVKRYGVKTLTIDPYNRLDNDYSKHSREDKYIDYMLSSLSSFAKKYNVLVIFVAHPTKVRGDDIPNMYSISGGSSWYNMADYGIIVHRGRDENGKRINQNQILVKKIKDSHLGDPSGGEAMLRYHFKDKCLIDDDREKLDSIVSNKKDWKKK